MPNTYVCTFATAEYAGSAELLRYSALRHGLADGVFVYRERDVAPLLAQYPELLPKSRGYGWWAWKPYVIRQTLARVHPGDVVVYCDAGVIVEDSLRGAAERVEHVLLHSLGQWPSKGYANRQWTKRDTFGFMERNADAHRDAVQVNAAVQVYRNTPEARAFVDEYLRWCTDLKVVDDACVLKNPPDFVEHRHDQSVLSLLAVGDARVRLSKDATQYGADDPSLGHEWFDAPVFDHHRRRREPVSVAVITPTTGGPCLDACVASVQAQDLPNITHWVVVDGAEHEAAVRATLQKYEHRHPLEVVVLPRNVGSGGWNGHRTYGAVPWIVDATYVAFLDDDNEFDPDHVRGLVRAVVGSGAAWAHSLRRIVDADGVDVCADNCESLGALCTTPEGGRLVDTSCYLLDRELAIRCSPAWNARFRDPDGRPEPDRALVTALLDAQPAIPHVVVRRHSVKYRVGATDRSVRAPYFLHHNAARGYDFAARRDVYVFHFSPDATRRMLEVRLDSTKSHALDEWNPTLWKGLDGASGGSDNGGAGGGDDERFNLLDGYACMPHIPPGATVAVAMCMPNAVPWDFLQSRPDLWRVAYTLESPNIRHADQWDPVLLAKTFDVVATYWKALLDDPRVPAVFCPHNSHHLDLDDPKDLAVLRSNSGVGASCAMVLERRDLAGQYRVPNVDVPLKCLDPMRELLVKDLTNVTVYGVGWDAAARRNPGITLGHALHRSRDPRSSVEILAGYTFAVIVENCDAEGYASEKLYDALMAGCVPLYWGSAPPHLQIPEGIDTGVYVDLRALLRGVPEAGMSAALQRFLDGLSAETIQSAKTRVAAQRGGILRQVGTRAFADVIRAAMASGIPKALGEPPSPSPSPFNVDGIPGDSDTGLALRRNARHFVALQQLMKADADAWKGCGSYLMGPDSLDYMVDMYPKQIALFESCKGARSVLEIGVHGGHSLLLVLLACDAHVVCVDICQYPHTIKCVEYLQTHFPGRITFKEGDSATVMSTMDGTFDVVHVDGDHSREGVARDLEHVKRLTRPGATVVVDDFCAGVAEAVRACGFLSVEYVPMCAWCNAVCRHV